MLAVLCALVSPVPVSEIWFIFTYETDAYIVEYMDSKRDMLPGLTTSPQTMYLHFSLYYFLAHKWQAKCKTQKQTPCIIPNSN
jgi:hypothetical protein